MFSEYSLLRELLIIQQTISIVCPSELPQIGNHACGRLYFKYNVVFIGLIKIKDVIEVFWVRKYLLRGTSIHEAHRNEKQSGEEGYKLWNFVGHHGWLTEKNFHFKLSKTARKTNICRR